MHVCTYARMHVCTYARMHVCAPIRVRPYVRAYTHANLYIRRLNSIKIVNDLKSKICLVSKIFIKF